MLQRHAGEGETIAEAIRDCLDYGKNPEKTESGKYISAYECDPATVADEFLLAKASYAAMTGREQKKANDVLCYQIRQSFYPGEITPKEANRIGYELAMRWTKGRHAFIVTTHTDRQHIHCHIYYNSTTLDCTRKFRNFWGSSFALRRLSDRLCLENGLSIVENPKPRSKGKYRNYGEWQKERKGPLSYQDRLRFAIDTALAERPADLDEFLSLMKRAGYEVKKVRGGGISFRLTGQGQEGCPGCGKIRKEEFEQFIFSAMQEKFKDFQILHGQEEKVNPKLTAYQVELAQVEAEIEKLLDTLTGANATLLAYANKKIEELDTRRQTISKAIADLNVETISPQQIKKLSYYLDNWESIDFDDKRKAADGLISTIKATSDRVQIEWKI